MSVNKVILLGHVGGDPEIRYPEQGVIVATFHLATNERRGEMEITEWHRIVMIGKNAEMAEKYIRKGTMLYVEGKLRTRSWEDKLNIKRSVTEILVERFELLGRKA